MTAPGYTAMKWKSTVRIKLGAPENKADRKLVEMVRTGLVACVRISTGSQQLEDSLIKLSRVVHGKLVDIRVHMAGTNPIEAGLTPRAKPTRGARRQRFRLAGPGSRCRRRSPRHGVTPPVARQAGRRTPALRSAPIFSGTPRCRRRDVYLRSKNVAKMGNVKKRLDRTRAAMRAACWGVRSQRWPRPLSPRWSTGCAAAWLGTGAGKKEPVRLSPPCGRLPALWLRPGRPSPHCASRTLAWPAWSSRSHTAASRNCTRRRQTPSRKRPGGLAAPV